MSLCPGTNTSVAENADVCIPETPPPLMSADVCNWEPPPPLKTADVLCGRPLSYFLFSKKFRKYLILLPAFYLIMWLMKLPKNFEKIAILKIGELVSF